MWGRTWGLGVLIALAQPAWADPIPWTLDDAMDRSGFVHASTADGGYVVVFQPRATDAVEHWAVTLRDVADGTWVLVYCTLLEADPDHPFPARLLEAALDYNGRAAGAKFAIDPDHGDLDVQYEIPIEGLSPSVVKRVVADVAATCDANRDGFAEIVDTARRER